MKKFFAILFLIAIVALVGYLIFNKEKSVEWQDDSEGLYQAKYYEKLSANMVQCFLCPNRCILSEGQIGLCKVRKNIEGDLYSLTYGKIASQHVDPIEKKPLFHVLPGSKAYSIATTGCNLRCIYCQNWEISQVFPWDVQYEEMTPEQIVEDALRTGSQSIAFTYNEPIVFYEYMLDIAKLAKKKGLKTVVISNGYINPEPLRELLKYIDAYKVDLKAFKDSFYQKFTGGGLEPVLETMKIIKEEGVWLEIVNLLIPGENDSEKEIREMAKWIKENLGDDVPLHFSRFHPQYKLQNLPPTPVETVIRAREIAMEEGLKYVYSGNIVYPEAESTYCPESGETAIVRQGYLIKANNLVDGKCPSGEEVPGIWK
jgi:pyruvate formate lyase activating enzyme